MISSIEILRLTAPFEEGVGPAAPAFDGTAVAGAIKPEEGLFAAVFALTPDQGAFVKDTVPPADVETQANDALETGIAIPVSTLLLQPSGNDGRYTSLQQSDPSIASVSSTNHAGDNIAIGSSPTGKSTSAIPEFETIEGAAQVGAEDRKAETDTPTSEGALRPLARPPGRADSTPSPGETTTRAFESAILSERASVSETEVTPAIDLTDERRLGAPEKFPVIHASAAATSTNASIRNQIIAVIAARQDDTKIEIALDPPELGKISIEFEGRSNGLQRVFVSAESAATVDLLKRSIDLLRQELSNGGLEGLNIGMRDFGGGDQRAPQPDIRHASTADSGVSEEIFIYNKAPDGRLDLRR